MSTKIRAPTQTTQAPRTAVPNQDQPFAQAQQVPPAVAAEAAQQQSRLSQVATKTGDIIGLAGVVCALYPTIYAKSDPTDLAVGAAALLSVITLEGLRNNVENLRTCPMCRHAPRTTAALLQRIKTCARATTRSVSGYTAVRVCGYATMMAGTAAVVSNGVAAISGDDAPTWMTAGVAVSCMVGGFVTRIAASISENAELSRWREKVYPEITTLQARRQSNDLDEP